MRSKISRRKFVIAASSLGPVMMAGRLGVLAETGGGSSGLFLRAMPLRNLEIQECLADRKCSSSTSTRRCSI
jgi:hypothetical protein